MSSEIPNREHAIGIRRSDPPATPEAPHADRAAIRGGISPELAFTKADNYICDIERQKDKKVIAKKAEYLPSLFKTAFPKLLWSHSSFKFKALSKRTLIRK